MEPNNKIRTAFDGISASEKLKADTRNFLRDARLRSVRPVRPVWRWAAGLVCALFLFGLGLESHKLFWTPFSYVSIDVNPSLELILNRFDRVISAEAYNEEGRVILADVSISGKYYVDAVEEIVESRAMVPYLSENAGLTFTVAASNGRKESVLLAGIKGSSGCVMHGGMSVKSDMAIVEEAHENGFSLGKYTAYQLLLQYDESVTAQDCQDMSMSEIHVLIREHELGQGKNAGMDTGGESGNEGNRERNQNADGYESENHDSYRMQESGTESYGTDPSPEDQGENMGDDPGGSVVPENYPGRGHHGSHHWGHGGHME